MQSRPSQHPAPDRLAAFGLGRLNESDADEVYRHLEKCAKCRDAVESAPDDALAALVRKVGGDSAPGGRTATAVVEIETLTGLASDRPFHKVQKMSPMAIACPHCGRKLMVPERGVGKQVRCPECRKPFAATAEPPEPATLPPGDASARPTDTVSEQPRQIDAEAAGVFHGRPELIDFLAPAQAPGEVGRLGPYRILKILGAGGMGVVYLAEDPHLQRKVALKAMLPALAASEAARSRFLREARTAAALEHDHIVPIYQVGEDRGIPFLAMQLLKGEPLDARLKRELKGRMASPLPLTEALRICRETAEGLAAAHGRGLIHRDIKPANLWLEGESGRVRILDFGLARSTASDEQLTQEGAILGTPAYMAPEQAGGKVGSAADLFSLGCVLYRLCTGDAPFKGADAISTLMAVATQQPKRPRELNARISPELSDLILRLLAKKPEERPASARAVVEAIRALEADPTQVLPPRRAAIQKQDRKPVPPPAPRARASWRRWLVMGAAVALIAVAAAVGVRLVSTRQEGPAVIPPPPPPPPPPEGWVQLFNGKDLTGWKIVGKPGAFEVKEDQGAVAAKASAPVSRLQSEKNYDDFQLRFEFRIASPSARSGLSLRMPADAVGVLPALKVQIRDDSTPYPNSQTGGLYYAGNGWIARERNDLLKPPGEWNEMEVTAWDRRVYVVVNGKQALNADLDTLTNKKPIVEAGRLSGRIAFDADLGEVWYRKIAVKPLLPTDDVSLPPLGGDPFPTQPGGGRPHKNGP